MKKYPYILVGVIIGLGLTIGSVVNAISASPTGYGGTGTTTPSGILYGSNSGVTPLQTVTIGSGCTFTGGTLSCAGTGVTSVATNNGLTGGTITTTGTIGLNTTGLSTNALVSWNGSNLVATGTPQLTVGSLLATSTTATSTFAYGINLSSGGCYAFLGTCLQTIITNATAYKQAVNYATAAVLSGTPTYSNGIAGVGATLTEVGLGALTVDGQTVSLGQRILVKDQADQTTNGIYLVSNAGSAIANYVLTRTTDYDESTDIYAGTTVPVLAGGTANADTQWTETTTGTIVLGTSNIAFEETSLGTNVVASLAGTTNQITASAATGAVTLSLPSLVVFPANASSSQLTVTGNTYLATASGNVGIGTTSPYRLLSVAGGNAVISSSGTTDLTLHDTAGTVPWTLRAGNGSATDFAIGHGNFTTDMTILSTGNVGIGTTSPTTLFALGNAVSSGGFYINSSGQLGIGTSTPTQGLAVQGNNVQVNGGQISTGWASTTVSSGAYTVNWNSGNQRILLNGAMTLTINATSSNPLDGGKKLEICQDSVGSRTITFATPGQLRWIGIAAATTTLVIAANNCQMFGFDWSGFSQTYKVASTTPYSIR